MTLSTRAPRDVTASILAEIAPNAARLKEATNSHLGRALLVAVNVHLLALGIFWAVSYASYTEPVVEKPFTGSFLPPESLPTPPSRNETPPGGGTPTRAAGTGIVTPVPDTRARPDATTATQSDMAVSTVGPVGPTASAGDGTPAGIGRTPRRPGAPTSGLIPPPIPPHHVDSLAEVSQPSFVDRAEIAPELVGGFAAFQAGIAYPRFEREAGNAGRVVVRFIVGTDGVPGSIEVVRSVSPGLDRAAMDAVRGARFTPGIQNGQAVAVRMTLPVTFQIR